jgi:dTDP-4-dehydrorhamnose reductase
VARKLISTRIFDVVTTSSQGNSDYRFSYTVSSLIKLIHNVRPDYIVNCIATTSPHASSTEIFKVNSLLPIQLALLSFTYKFRTIHVSTNAVFSGRKEVNSERTIPFPVSRYGFSKLIGDFSCFKSLVIRTSFIGISEHKNSDKGIVAYMMSLPSNSNFEVKVNYLWNGVTVNSLAELISTILMRSSFPKGIIHFFTEPPISRMHLLTLILTLINRHDISLETPKSSRNQNLSLTSSRMNLVTDIWKESGYASIPSIEVLLSEITV